MKWIALIVLLSAHSAGAVNIGAGTTSCGSWTSHKASNIDLYNFKQSWLGGYMTAQSQAINAVRNVDILAGTDFAALRAWVDNYCQAHPLETLNDAAIQLTVELSRRAPGK